MTEQLIILIEIILIDLVLAGDNAIIIGMVASKFEDSNRKKIIFLLGHWWGRCFENSFYFYYSLFIANLSV